MREVLASTAGPLRLNAQEQLTGWYGAFGFEVSGPPFDEDGIRHVPMRMER
jgi:ElaA protein